MLDFRTAATAVAFVTLVALTGGSADASSTWKVDPVRSSAQFSVRHLVVGTVRGTIPVASASLETLPDAGLPAVISATLDVTAVDTHDADRDRDLRGADWLDTARFPTITFKSTSIVTGPDAGSFRATGSLTINGTTTSVTLVGRALGTTKGTRDRIRGGYAATTTIDRRDLLNLPGTTPGGSLIAGTDVTIEAVATPRAGRRREARIRAS